MTGQPFVISRAAAHRTVFPRSQREAGIESLRWEERLKAPRPLWVDFTVGFAAATALFLALLTMPSLHAAWLALFFLDGR
ncbi:MAG: hypothetical protein JO256_09135 [Alphaproteobacteria bacterium]|nr:hypothetical protein [Alphaproteobacteria bacterium]